MKNELKRACAFLLMFALFPSSLAVAQSRDDPALQRVEPFQVFDNLYYVGAEWVGCRVLETSEGLILLDSLYGDFVDLAVNGIAELGMDPADIRAVLVTHGHFDHVGGAKRIQEQYGATVAMMREDWNLVAGEPVYRPYPKPQQDLVVKDGDTFTLGDTTITFYKTPGHTPGVMSMKFTVFDNGEPHTAFMFGGVGLNFSGVERTQMYIESVERIKRLEGIEVNIPNHANSGEVFERRDALAQRQPGAAHPFVDSMAFDEWLDELLVAAREKLAEERASRN